MSAKTQEFIVMCGYTPKEKNAVMAVLYEMRKDFPDIFLWENATEVQTKELRKYCIVQQAQKIEEDASMMGKSASFKESKAAEQPPPTPAPSTPAPAAKAERKSRSRGRSRSKSKTKKDKNASRVREKKDQSMRTIDTVLIPTSTSKKVAISTVYQYFYVAGKRWKEGVPNPNVIPHSIMFVRKTPLNKSEWSDEDWKNNEYAIENDKAIKKRVGRSEVPRGSIDCVPSHYEGIYFEYRKPEDKGKGNQHANATLRPEFKQKAMEIYELESKK